MIRQAGAARALVKGVNHERCGSGSKRRMCNEWKDMRVSEKHHENCNPIELIT